MVRKPGRLSGFSLSGLLRGLGALPGLLGVLALPAGAPAQQPYRAVLRSPGGELPFELLLEPSRAVLVNGRERIELRSVQWDGERLHLEFPVYDSRIEARADRDGVLSGTWTKRRGASGDTEMAFRALPGRQPRFPPDPDDKPDPGLAGRYRVQFEADPHPAVGVFEVDASGTATGTFLTTLGDYRYLAGDARGGRLRLSCFDGAHAFLFVAERGEDGALQGGFWSSDRWHETWTAVRDPAAELPEAFDLTSWDRKAELAALTCTGLDGEPQRLGDLFGRATLVQLFGTWCPNCNDASAYLGELDARYRQAGLRIVGLAFEHGADRERNAAQVRAYLARHDCRYPVLLAGPSDKAGASRAFPILDRVRAYPTTLFVDERGRIRAVHTGFAGPATGAEHRRLRDRFEALIEELLAR